MKIIPREKEYAERLIEECSLGDSLPRTINLIAKYYWNIIGNKKRVEEEIIKYLKSCDNRMSVAKIQDVIDNAICYAQKVPMINIENISITKNEMDVVDGLSGKQIRRLAFTLLCLAKYKNAINPANNNWINFKDSEIMRLANINTSLKRQYAMYRTLEECGMLTFSKRVDGTAMRVEFIEDGDVVCEVSDFRNLGYQYLMFRGEPYFKCDCCGITTKMRNPEKGRKQKYCNECALKISLRQKVNSAMNRQKT